MRSSDTVSSILLFKAREQYLFTVNIYLETCHSVSSLGFIASGASLHSKNLKIHKITPKIHRGRSTLDRWYRRVIIYVGRTSRETWRGTFLTFYSCEGSNQQDDLNQKQGIPKSKSSTLVRQNTASYKWEECRSSYSTRGKQEGKKMAWSGMPTVRTWALNLSLWLNPHYPVPYHYSQDRPALPCSCSYLCIVDYFPGVFLSHSQPTPWDLLRNLTKKKQIKKKCLTFY